METKIIDGIEYRKENYLARDGVEEIRRRWFYIPRSISNPIAVGHPLDLIGYFLWNDTKKIMYQPDYGATDLPDQYIYFAAGDWIDKGKSELI